MDLASYLKVIEKFLSDYLKDNRLDTYILGVSGGVDSSLCAAIAKNAVGRERLHCLIIPIASSKEDVDDALTLVKDLDLRYTVIDATETFNQYVETFSKSGIELDRSTLGNLKARMRMSILFAVAQKDADGSQRAWSEPQSRHPRQSRATDDHSRQRAAG